MVTDAGFAGRFVAALALESSSCAIVSVTPSLAWAVDDVTQAVEHQLLSWAHGLGWWAAVALLASSCCALQVILSACALGCAGLNNWLGPLRPVGLATAVVLQAGSWYTVVRAAPCTPRGTACPPGTR